jgi:hypothetical protein
MRQLLAGGVQRVMKMENEMFVISHVAGLFLVLMGIGTGFMFIKTAAKSFPPRSYCSVSVVSFIS